MVYAVIMAGGSGTRFWPASRRRKPKQLLAVSGARTMIRATVERILPVIPFSRIMAVTAAAHADKVRGQLPELSPGMVLVEPQGRNTAPCVALAAYKLVGKDPDAVMAVLPADHLIKKEKEFYDALESALEVAATGEHLLTFGVVPNRPETGYGYIALGEQVLEIGSRPVYRVLGFREKPDPATAQRYVESGQYLWNSGMFVWKATAIIEAIRTCVPRLSDAMERIAGALNTPDEAEAIKATYDEVDPISIDYAVMEHARNILCIPIDVEWNDVGSWASLVDVWERDECGNVADGEAVLIDCSGCVISTPQKMTALIGVDDLIVVDTPDALMICRKDKAQEVRKLQEMLKTRGYDHLL
ncbi:MAG: mannose-1-phosphate guanylyltransferase [Desulfomonile sp.]|nr:mannose-1-phosphate guanylyltransferase [Desulfomonile sp.]